MSGTVAIIASCEVAGDRFVNLLAGPTLSTTNGYETLFLAPDGSKEGWDDSEMGEVVRLVFAGHVLEAYPDADLVQVTFGGDYGVECGPKVAEVEPAVLRLAPHGRGPFGLPPLVWLSHWLSNSGQPEAECASG